MFSLLLGPLAEIWPKRNGVGYLGQCFSSGDVYTDYLEALLKCRFWFSGSGVGLEVLHF